jgi:imidazolonepropionase-like amidohydrolase
VAAAVAALVATTAVGRSQTPIAHAPLVAITHVTVVDTAAGELRRDMTVVVTGERITEVGPAGRVRLVESAQQVDGRGKFLSPGLWDMHVHGLSPGPASAILPLLVANGVTGIRQMSDPLPAVAAVRREMLRSDGRFAAAPRVGGWAGTDLIGPIPPGGPSFTVAPLVAATPEEGRAAVDRLLASGADFVKVRDHLSPDTYRAILQHARQRNVHVAGHVPYDIDVRTASDLGQRSIEHMAGIPVACSSDEDLIRRDLPTLLRQTYGSAPEVDTALMQRTTDTFDRSKCLALGRHLAKNGTWVTPTLSVFDPDRAARILGRAERPLERYMPADALEYWRQASSRDPIAKAADRLDRYFQALLAMVAALHDGGAGVLVGTDAPLTQIYPGFSVHEELAWLVRAGLTPAQALRSATLAPARFLGREHELGSVATGKFADLVLLDADPLAAIGNTTRINAVVANGRLFRRTDLDDLLAKAEAAANK